jgi:hypothetical protein
MWWIDEAVALHYRCGHHYNASSTNTDGLASRCPCCAHARNVPNGHCTEWMKKNMPWNTCLTYMNSYVHTSTALHALKFQDNHPIALSHSPAPHLFKSPALHKISHCYMKSIFVGCSQVMALSWQIASSSLVACCAATDGPALAESMSSSTGDWNPCAGTCAPELGSDDS